jgi:hypothetical protein
MLNVLGIALLSLSVLGIGIAIVYRWFTHLPFAVARLAAVGIVGMVGAISLCYAGALTVQWLPDPVGTGAMLAAGVLVTGTILAWGRRKRFPLPVSSALADICSLSLADAIVIVAVILFSFWMMGKSFRSAGETVFVGSNEVFDFGHSLAIVRSFSRGGNVPFTSPFVAGQVHLYHFMFYYGVGLLERFGVPIGWAMNIPSAMAFALMVLVVYCLPQVLYGRNPKLGIVAAVLAVTHATLGFFQYVANRGISPALLRNIWTLPKYPFAGPFDGSPISLFWTLNVFVNQRHLAMGIAVALLAFMLLLPGKGKRLPAGTVAVVAGLVALSAAWHIVLWGIAVYLSVWLLWMQGRKWETVLFAAVSLAALPAVWDWGRAVVPYLIAPKTAEVIPTVHAVPPPVWLRAVLNLGVLLFIVPFGYIRSPHSVRRASLPVVAMLAGILAVSAIGQEAVAQKLQNFAILFADCFAAYVLVRWWSGSRVFKGIAGIMLFVLTVSGIMDLMVIKNDFAYPLIDGKTAALISWIDEKTTVRTVFLSYPDIIDPVALAGRYNYAGFYRNRLQPDRTAESVRLYMDEASDSAAFRTRAIDYVVIPKMKHGGVFSPQLIQTWLSARHPVYTDDSFAVFSFR